MIIHKKIIQVKTVKKKKNRCLFNHKIFHGVLTFIKLYGYSHIDLVLELKISKYHGS